MFTLAIRDSPALGTNMGLRISSPGYQPRPNARRSKEAELMAGFLELKRSVKSVASRSFFGSSLTLNWYLRCIDILKFELTELLSPFFAILRSPLSTGPITSAALSALHSFFVCGLISSTSPALDAAMIELSSTLSHCKFEASDSSGDEVVLLKIMTVIQDCFSGSIGLGLGDIEVCEMLETVLTTCCQMRLSGKIFVSFELIYSPSEHISETLRRSAETTMHTLVRIVFSKLKSLDPEEEETKLEAEVVDDSKEGELRMTVTTQDQEPTLEQKDVTQPVETTTESLGSDEIPQESHPSRTPLSPGPRPACEFWNPAKHTILTAHQTDGLPSIVELLRVIINVLDPNDQQHTDSTRLTALRILNTAFEEAGPYIAEFGSLKAIIVDTGCKFLFQLARSENVNVLQWSLRTTSTIFETMRKHLKLQQELFLTFTIDRLTPPPSPGKGNSTFGRSQPSSRLGTPANNSSPLLMPADKSESETTSSPSRLLVPPAKGETRDLILETLSQIAGHASFMVELYTNYDCDPNCENLFERLVDFLTKVTSILVTICLYPHILIYLGCLSCFGYG